MELTHPTTFACHLGVNKTKYYSNKFAKNRLHKNVLSIMWHLLKTTRKGRVPQAFIQDTHKPSRQFQKLATDIVDTIKMINKGNRYILTAINLCIRWPDAILLKYICSEAISYAFWIIFQETVLSDRGTQFVSLATQELLNY